MEMSVPFFYEGAEKLLEVWFDNPELDSTGDAGSKTADLRAIPRLELDGLVGTIGAEIVSVMSSPSVDAYVLSESSMFVSKQRMILKTCGTTKLIAAIRPLIELVKKYTSLGGITELYYSRKAFLRPDLQDLSYSSFAIETKQLDTEFDGTAYTFGKGDRSWYLYVFTAEVEPNRLELNRVTPGSNHCLEIMMEQLDPAVMAIFTRKSSASAEIATQDSGIKSLISKMKIDDFLFDPCGYSMNGLIGAGEYATIHITPESAFSYVSFETNVALSRYPEIIAKVLAAFRPGKFICVVHEQGSDSALGDSGKFLKLADENSTFAGFAMMDIEAISLRNHRLSYLSFVQDIT